MYSVRRRGSLDPDELAASLHDYVVVDVRDRSGWSGGHIPGSIHVPITNLDSDVIGDDKRSPLAVLADNDRQAEVGGRRTRTKGMGRGDDQRWGAGVARRRPVLRHQSALIPTTSAAPRTASPTMRGHGHSSSPSLVPRDYVEASGVRPRGRIACSPRTGSRCAGSTSWSARGSRIAVTLAGRPVVAVRDGDRSACSPTSVPTAARCCSTTVPVPDRRWSARTTDGRTGSTDR